MEIEESGRTVDEAVGRALEALGVSRDEVQIEVLAPGTRGMLGLGAREARVRVTIKDGVATVARSLADRLFRAMGYTPVVVAEAREDGIYVDAHGAALGALIGRHGATLDAIDFLLEAMTAKRTGKKVKVVLDVEGYRARRRKTLESLARRVAQRAQREGRAVALEPMGARERRLIHTALAEDPAVMTYSEGEEPLRRVVVAPKEREINRAPGSPEPGRIDE
jgi:spoIIIJ-associated protein